MSTVQCTCENKTCRKTFEARVADRKRGWARYCSKSCKATVQTRRIGSFNPMCRPHNSLEGAEGGGWDAHKVWNS